MFLQTGNLPSSSCVSIRIFNLTSQIDIEWCRLCCFMGYSEIASWCGFPRIEKEIWIFALKNSWSLDTICRAKLKLCYGNQRCEYTSLWKPNSFLKPVGFLLLIVFGIRNYILAISFLSIMIPSFLIAGCKSDGKIFSHVL
jgi:hypothetical protein